LEKWLKGNDLELLGRVGGGRIKAKVALKLLHFSGDDLKFAANRTKQFSG
jgi:hypothetical protein